MRDVIYVKLDKVQSVNKKETISRKPCYLNIEIKNDNFTVRLSVSILRTISIIY